jgi:hypothetical protein
MEIIAVLVDDRKPMKRLAPLAAASASASASVFALALTLLTGLALFGCQAKPEPNSVAFFMSHPGQREAMMASCRAAGEARQAEGDCVNAGDAWLASWGVRPVWPSASQADRQASVK